MLSPTLSTITILSTLAQLAISHPRLAPINPDTSTTASASASRNRITTWTESDPLPLVIWHGLGDKYDNEGLLSVAELAEETIPGIFVYIIRLDEDPSSDRSATFFGNVTEQINEVCEDLADHPILSTAPGINALGFSQGGVFLRGYVERCNNPPVKNLVTFGSPHNGIAEFKGCGLTDWLCRSAMALLRSNTWSSFVQSRLVPAQYYRSVNESTGVPTDEYLENSNYLADINNERATKNSTYKKALESLDNFAMYVFENDTVVIPKETSWFADVRNLTSGDVQWLRERKVYKEDWLGLKGLDEDKKLHFRTVKGVDHMRLSDEVLVEAFTDFFAPQDGGDEESGKAVDDIEVDDDEDGWVMVGEEDLDEELLFVIQPVNEL